MEFENNLNQSENAFNTSNTSYTIKIGGMELGFTKSKNFSNEIKLENLLFKYSASGNLELVKQLCEENHFDKKTINSAIQKSIFYGNFELVKYFHIELDADLETKKIVSKNIGSKTTLEIIKYLHENGANILEDDNNAMTWACIHGNLNLVKYLYANGASISMNKYDVIAHASLDGNLELLIFLHRECKGDLTADNNKALKWAKSNNKLKIIEYLIQNGCKFPESKNTQKMH